MTGREIIEHAAQVLAQDHQLNAWCQEHFHRSLSINIGWTPDQTPSLGWDYPVCSLATWILTTGEGERMASLEINIEAVICGHQSISRAEGVLLADDLICLVRDALARGFVGTELRAETTAGHAEDAPIFVARANITINRLRTRRAGMGR